MTTLKNETLITNGTFTDEALNDALSSSIEVGEAKMLRNTCWVTTINCDNGEYCDLNAHKCAFKLPAGSYCNAQRSIGNPCKDPYECRNGQCSTSTWFICLMVLTIIFIVGGILYLFRRKKSVQPQTQPLFYPSHFNHPPPQYQVNLNVPPAYTPRY